MREKFRFIAATLALMIGALIIGALITGSWAARAQDGEPPRYFRVAPLAANDELTVRAEPAGDAERLGSLPGGAGPLETLSIERRGGTDWAEIAWEDGDAWVAARFLEPVAPPLLGESALPLGLSCVGTEPFWALDIETQASARWSSPMAPEPRAMRIDAVVSAQARLGWPAAVWVSAKDSQTGMLLARPGRCSDGMSDRTYGWLASYQTSVEGQRVLYEGCCRLRMAQ